MGSGKKPKQRVADYYMSIHLGVAHAVDKILALYQNETKFWSGNANSNTTLTIDKRDLFGGVKKEGGVSGEIEVMLGGDNQLASTRLAGKLGGTPSTLPGFRGITSLLLTGINQGFYLGSNSPYLKPISAKVERIFRGFASDKAEITEREKYIDWNSLTYKGSPSGSTPLPGGATLNDDESFLVNLNKMVSFSYANSNGLFRISTNRGMTWVDTWIPLQNFPTGTICTQKCAFEYLGSTYMAYTTLEPNVSGQPTKSQIFRIAGFDWTTMSVGDEVFSWEPPSTMFDRGATNFGLVQIVGSKLACRFSSNATGGNFPGTWALSINLNNFMFTISEIEMAFTSTVHTYFELPSGQCYLRRNSGLWDYRPTINSPWVPSRLRGQPSMARASGGNSFFAFALLEGSTTTIRLHYTEDGGENLTLVLNPSGFPLTRSEYSSVFYFDDKPFAKSGDALVELYTDGPSCSAKKTYAGFPTYNPGDFYLDPCRDIAPDDDDTLPKKWYWKPTRLTRPPIYFEANEVVENEDAPSDINPAHIIYECLTNKDWGLGMPESMLDLASFEAAATTLHAEKFGMSLMWTNQTTIEAFINDVLAHIDATYGIDPTTGKVYLKLIRADYDLAALPTLDDDTNCVVTKFSRKSLSETTNEVVVTWTNPINEQEETVAVHDIANFSQLGQINSASSNYYGVRNANVALRCAMRDLAKGAYPVASFEIEASRTAWNFKSGDVVKLNYAKQGISNLPIRIMSINYGKPGDMKITITAVEDVFDLPASAYVEYSKGEYPAEDNTPTPMTNSAVVTAPYYVIARQLGDTDATLATAAGEAYAMVMATHTNAAVTGYDLTEQVTTATGALEPAYINTYSQCGRGTTTSALDNTGDSATLQPLANVTGATPVAVGNLILLTNGLGENEELLLVNTVNSDGTFVVTRACLDTTHKSHSVGAITWIIDPLTATVDESPKVEGQNATYRLLTRTINQVLDFAAAPNVVGAMTDRASAPYRPGNIKIDGVDRPTTATGPITVTWAHRNRQLENPVIVAWSAGSVAVEAGTTYTVKLWKDYGTISAAVLAEVSNVAGTTATLTPYKPTPTTTTINLTVEVYAVRNSRDSYQHYTHTLSYTFDVGQSALVPAGSRFMFYDPSLSRAVFARRNINAALGTAADSPHGHWWVNTSSGAVTEKLDTMILETFGTVATVVDGCAIGLPMGAPTPSGPGLARRHYLLSDFYSELPATTVSHDGVTYDAIDQVVGDDFVWDTGSGGHKYPVSGLEWSETEGSFCSPISNGTTMVEWHGKVVLVTTIADIATSGYNRVEHATAVPGAAMMPAGPNNAGLWISATSQYLFVGDIHADVVASDPVWVGPHVVLTDLTTYNPLSTLPITPAAVSYDNGLVVETTVRLVFRTLGVVQFAGAIYLLGADFGATTVNGLYQHRLFKSTNLGSSWAELTCPGGQGMWGDRLAAFGTKGLIVVSSDPARQSYISDSTAIGWQAAADTSSADLSTPSTTIRLGATPSSYIGDSINSDLQKLKMSPCQQWPLILPNGKIMAMTYDTGRSWSYAGGSETALNFWISDDGKVYSKLALT